jgi:UDP-glucose 4-epimerase
MKHIILGGAGFIGTRLTNHLMHVNSEILVLDKRKVLDKNKQTGVNYEVIDICKEQLVLNSISKYYNTSEEIILWHLAANSDIRSGLKNHFVDYLDTLGTTCTAISISKKFNIKMLVFSSSSAIYGDLAILAVDENYCSFSPISNYGAMKLASEQLIKVNNSLTKIPTRIFRFPNVIGWPGTHGIIFDLRNKLKVAEHELEVLGDGQQTKPYIHVDDLIKIMLKLVYTLPNFDIINIGPKDNGISVREIANQLVKKFNPGLSIKYQNTREGWFGDVPNYKFDTSKLFNLITDLELSSFVALCKTLEEM